MTLKKPGVLLSRSEGELGELDAFHVPCALVQCTSKVSPGSSVQFITRTNTEYVRPCSVDERDGIVDPFLVYDLDEYSDYFYMFIDPSKVEKLTHTFTIEGMDLEDDGNDYDDGCRGCY